MMCVYLCVVVIEAWPRNSWTIRISAPFSRNRVATVWRSMCGVMCFFIPASCASLEIMLAIPWVEILFLKMFTKRAVFCGRSSFSFVV